MGEEEAQSDQQELHCPVGELECSLLSELARVRKELVSLQALVRTDELTGLYNYRHFLESLELEMERTRRSGQAMTLIMLDLDHFKLVNDNWGHEFGNTALAAVSKILMETVRRVDISCRFGGEELAVILPGTSLKSAVKLAERLCEKVRELSLFAQDEPVGITASFGVDIYSPVDTDNVSQFVRRTDVWLLQAKEEGRNRVCHAPYQEEVGVSQDERDMLLNG